MPSYFLTSILILTTFIGLLGLLLTVLPMKTILPKIMHWYNKVIHLFKTNHIEKSRLDPKLPRSLFKTPHKPSKENISSFKKNTSEPRIAAIFYPPLFSKKNLFFRARSVINLSNMIPGGLLALKWRIRK